MKRLTVKKLILLLITTYSFSQLINCDRYKIVTVYDLFDKIEKNDKVRYGRLNELSFKDKSYNFKIYIDGYMKTGKKVTDNVVDNVHFTERSVKIHADKLLYSSLKKYNSQILKINALLNSLNIKNRVNSDLVLGLNTYSNLLFLQQKIDILNKIIKRQKSIYDYLINRYNEGVGSKIDVLNAKIDLANLNQNLISSYKDYAQNLIIFNYLYGDNKNKDYYFMPFLPKFAISLKQLQKEVLKNNYNAKIAKLNLKKSFYNYQKSSLHPININFYSFAGYTQSIQKTFNLGSDLNSFDWEMGVTFNIPLYDAQLKQARENSKVNYLIQREAYKSDIQKILRNVYKIYQNIIYERKNIKIIRKKIDVYKEEIDFYQNRIYSGLNEYTQYATVLKNYLNEMINLRNSVNRLNTDILLLKILSGRSIGEN